MGCEALWGGAAQAWEGVIGRASTGCGWSECGTLGSRRKPAMELVSFVPLCEAVDRHRRRVHPAFRPLIERRSQRAPHALGKVCLPAISRPGECGYRPNG